MQVKTGAGVIPFARCAGQTWFLFHKTFSGRRAGLVVDFGGGSNPHESQLQTAAREFIEETEGLFFAKNCDDDLAPQYPSQYARIQRLIRQTQSVHPDWFCTRASTNANKTRNWKTYFVEVEYRELGLMNTAWAEDEAGRFKKRRELYWLSADALIEIIDKQPNALWKRLRQYRGMREIVLAISCADQ